MLRSISGLRHAVKNSSSPPKIMHSAEQKSRFRGPANLQKYKFKIVA